MDKGEMKWCRWRAALAGVGLLATGISIGVGAANYTNMRIMRGHTERMAKGQEVHVELSRRTLQAPYRRVEDPVASRILLAF